MKRYSFFLLFALVLTFPPFAFPESIHEKYGLPSSENLIRKDTYIVSFNNDYKIPNWTVEQLTANELAFNRKRSGTFKRDPDYPGQVQATGADYRGSGYDQGHLTPSADMVRTLEAMTGTFVYTNCAPQVGAGFNRDIWQLLEKQVRDWAEAKDQVWIYTGVYAMPDADNNIQYIGNEIVIPTHWYKIIYAPNGPTANDDEAIGFLMENKAYDENDYIKWVTSIDDVEKLTGLDFLNKLSKGLQNKLESKVKVGTWN